MAKIFVVLIMIGLVAACSKDNATAANSKEMDEAIKQYILKNPEVLVESLTNYQKDMSELSDKDTTKLMAENEKDIFQNPNSPVVGNPKGTDVIVEFFDYNCGYCKTMVPDIIKLVSENKNLKVIMKELPVLGPSSEASALAALVVHDIAPDKYFAFHSELMAHEGQQDEALIRDTATKAGVEPNTVMAKMKDAKYVKMLEKNSEIARAFKIQGTPTFIVNGKILRGAAGYDGLKKALASKAE